MTRKAQKRRIGWPGSAWNLVIAGGALDVVWALLLKRTNGFTSPGPTLLAAVCIAASYTLYIKAIARLPVGPAYTLFTGIGTAGTAVMGILVLGERAEPSSLPYLGLLLLGMAGLGLSERRHGSREKA
ncbi:multidrug efflux SMR transporter [Saccharibacillus sp. CPCC 101409]|uniref:DMT family transporter n=1 Tax=Saccharibacillus sp. CPCC 101409 TaxID=3058041 RepID=UPI002672B338|nr:multidrug efflux SMR transporter [Saccharibacillus sp. CPCC 101409]MDO3410189.1 multidrug efflux SMR transporter [Saccharibacillus sp. CPCC 101409]